MSRSLWQVAFLAMSSVLGESPDDALAALGEDEAKNASDLGRLLASGASVRGRAGAIASALAVVARDVEAMRLT